MERVWASRVVAAGPILKQLCISHWRLPYRDCCEHEALAVRQFAPVSDDADRLLGGWPSPPDRSARIAALVGGCRLGAERADELSDMAVEVVAGRRHTAISWIGVQGYRHVRGGEEAVDLSGRVSCRTSSQRRCVARVSLSAWLNAAAERAIRIEDGLAAVREWEQEHGELSTEELAWADKVIASDLRA